MSERRIEMDDGAVLQVGDDGQGPVVVLVNGAFCTLRQWDHVVSELQGGFRFIRHDVRGSGRSTGGPNAGNCFERFADDIAQVCDELGVESASLWGMAWGARVALVAAVRHPERFERLVLSDLGITPADVDAQKAGAKAAAQACSEAGIDLIPQPEGWRDHVDFGQAKKAMAATFLHEDLMPFVERVTQPTLIATGEHDPNLVSSRRALEGLRDGMLEVLPATGHGSVLQRPDVVARVVSPFLRS